MMVKRIIWEYFVDKLWVYSQLFLLEGISLGVGCLRDPRKLARINF